MIIINLDVMLAQRKISSGELAARVGITPANLSILKTGKAKAMRFSTLEAICRALECQPGDVLEFREDDSPPATREALAHWCRVLGAEPPEEGMGTAEVFYKAIGEAVENLEKDEEAQ